MYLTNALLRNQSVANIVINDNHITAAAARHLAELGANSEYLNRVQLANTELAVDELAGRRVGAAGRAIKYVGVQLDPLDYVIIGEVMKVNRSTKELEIRGCPMTDLDISWINGMLTVNKTLRRLTITARSLGEPGVRTLLEAVAQSRLQHLDLQGAPVTPSSAATLCEVLKTSRTLRSLYLYWNSLGDAGAAAICAALMSTPQPVLETLVVFNNDLTAVGASAMAEMLKRNTVLRSIALVSNQLQDEGAAALSEALATNATLTQVDLSKCHLGWHVTDLCGVLRTNRSITALNLSGNLINSTESEQLAVALRDNRVLRTLTLSVATLPVPALLGFAYPRVRTLSFAEQELATVDAFFIAKCLRVNSVLTSLDVSGNFLREHCVKAIARNLHHNDTLRRLKVGSVFWVPVQDVRGRVVDTPALRYPKAGLDPCDFVVVGELLRKNQAVRTLDLRGNDMHQVHEIECLAPALALNESLTELSFVWNTFGPDGTCVLADALLARGNKLRALTLRAVGVGPGKGADAFARILAQSSTLTAVECVLNSLGATGTAAVAAALLRNDSITSLDLKNNLMGNDGAKSMSAALARRSPLVTLNLRENKIDADGVYALCEGLEAEACPLRELNLSYNRFGVSGAHSLAEMLRLNSVLRSLNVNSTKLHSEGAAAIGAMLRVNRTLAYLSVSCKTVGTAGALAIARALKYNRELQVVQLGVCKLPVQDMLGSTSQTKIDLSSSHLTDMDTGFVAECLRSNRVCTYLDVSGNKISNHAVGVLNDALQHNVVLQRLKLDELEIAVQDLFGSTGANAISFAGQPLSERDSVFIAATLNVNTPMNSLDLTDCNIGPAACQHLGQAFTKNGAITTLKLGHNNFGSVGAIALAPVLQADNVLQVLDLAGNEVGQDGAVALAHAVKDNWVISLIRFDTMVLPVQDLRGTEDVTSINYADCDLVWYDVIFLTEVLRHNRFVTSLDLSCNDLSNTSARCVAILCKHNRFIRSIRLVDNDFNSVVGHIFADNLKGNRVVVDLELDEEAMSVRTRKELKNLIKLNRRFVGEFDGGRLLRGEQRFMNGDVLRFEGDDSLQGYEASGVYHVHANPAIESVVLLTCAVAALAEVGLAIAAIAYLFSRDDPPVFAAVLIALCLTLVTLLTAHLVRISGRPDAALLQVTSLLTCKDAMDVLHRRRIQGVTMDIRSEVPIFSFLPVARLRSWEGCWRAAPIALILALVTLGSSSSSSSSSAASSSSASGSDGVGGIGVSSIPVAALVAALFSAYTGVVVADLHFTRVASWSAKVDAINEWEDAVQEQLASQRSPRQPQHHGAAATMPPGARAGAAAGGKDDGGGGITTQVSHLAMLASMSSQRRLDHPWSTTRTASVLAFRALEVYSRLVGVAVLVLLWGFGVLGVLAVDWLAMMMFWVWKGDKVMENVRATLYTSARVVLSMLLFPGFGDLAPEWVVGTNRLAPAFYLVVRGVEDVICAILLLALGLGNDDGVSDAVVVSVGLALLLKQPAAWFYHQQLAELDEVCGCVWVGVGGCVGVGVVVEVLTRCLFPLLLAACCALFGCGCCRVLCLR